MSDSVAELAGLLITKPTAPDKGASGSDAIVEHADADDIVDGENVDNPTPGDTGADDDAGLWTSAADADDALTGEQPEASDDEGAESGDGEGADAGDAEPFYTVTLDGKEEKVSLSELRNGYQRTADYTRKTQEIAERRKAVDAEHEAASRARSAYDETLKDLQSRLEGATSQRKADDWEKLRAENPEQYAVEWADYQRRVDARNAVITERQRVAKEQATENDKKLREFIQGERTKLLEKIPEWKDQAKYAAGAKVVLDFAGKTYGFTEQELATAYDHRVIVMARDAMRFRSLVAKQNAAKAKLNGAPPVAPRGRTPGKTARQRVTQEATQRFKRSGKIDDAVALLVR